MKTIKDKNVNLFDNYSMKLFFMIMLYFFITLVLYVFCNIINFRNCFSIIQILSISTPLFLNFYLSNYRDLKKDIFLILIYFVLLIFVPFLFGRTYDLTTDGNGYHKTAIAYLKNGWNPLRESSESYQMDNNKIFAVSQQSNINLWIDHYPKASWIIAANMYNMTNNIESGKSLNLILSVMLIILAYNCFNVFLKKKWSLFLAILLSLNPIFIAQIFTYYVDGLMGVCFLIQLFLLFLVDVKKNIDYKVWISIAANSLIFVNLKFTGLLCSGIIAFVFYVYWLFSNRKDKDIKNIFKRVTICFVIVYMLSIFFVGSNSYILNTVQHHNPLYPIIGPDKVDIVTTMEPQVFVEENGFVKFFWSLFSKTENVTYYSGDKPILKVPYKVYKSELDTLYVPDLRIAGFGPLFSAIFILSCVTLIVSFIKLFKNEKEKCKYVAMIFIALILSIVLVGEGWWARYVPQLYLLPIFALALFIYTFQYFKFKRLNIFFNVFLSLTLLINTYFFIDTQNKSLDDFKKIREDIFALKDRKSVLLRSSIPEMYGYYYNLRDYNIDFKIQEEFYENTFSYKYSWRVMVVENEEPYKIDKS